MYCDSPQAKIPRAPSRAKVKLETSNALRISLNTHQTNVLYINKVEFCEFFWREMAASFDD